MISYQDSDLQLYSKLPDFQVRTGKYKARVFKYCPKRRGERFLSQICAGLLWLTSTLGIGEGKGYKEGFYNSTSLVVNKADANQFSGPYREIQSPCFENSGFVFPGMDPKIG